MEGLIAELRARHITAFSLVSKGDEEPRPLRELDELWSRVPAALRPYLGREKIGG